MGHREYMRYTERLKRDMDVLKASHEIVNLSHKIDRLKDELPGQTEAYSSFLEARRAIAGRIRDCGKIPPDSRDYLYAKCFDLLPSERDPRDLALKIQDFALEVSQCAKDRSHEPEVRLIFKALMELADTALLL